MNTAYKILPLVNLSATKVLRGHKKTTTRSLESQANDIENANTVLELAGFEISQFPDKILVPKEKFMIELQRSESSTVPHTEGKASNVKRNGNQKPHYTRLIPYDSKLLFQAACCLPLKIVAASLDGKQVEGRILFNNHSDEFGGKLVYEFLGKGNELIVDLMRGESVRAQRLTFHIIDHENEKSP